MEIQLDKQAWAFIETVLDKAISRGAPDDVTLENAAEMLGDDDPDVKLMMHAL